MKRWIFMLGLILLITGSNAWSTAIVQTTDYISFPVVALDSLTGVECVPESVHIHVWRGSLTNTTVYSNREVGDGADLAQIDSVATGYAGAVPQQYYFHDKIEDIDGDGTAGVYTINVRLWRGTTPTSNWFSFQVVDSSFANALTRIGQINEDTKLLATATAHAAYETLYVHKADFHSSGDTNSNPFQAGTDNVFLTANYQTIGDRVYDTLFVHKSDFHSSGDTNSNPFQAGTDDVFLTANYQTIGDRVYDTLFVHKGDFHSSGDTNSNPFQAGTDDVFLTINYQTAADSFWLADTSQYSGDDDSTMAGLAWRNKNLYDNQNWNVWDDGTRTLTVADWSTHSAADVWTAGSRSLSTPADYKADVTKLDVEVSSRFTQAGGDSVKDYTKAIRDTVNAHAPHGDDWASAGAGSSPWTAAGVGSVYVYLDSTADAITDANKANFKYGGGADSVRAYLATHDSTLLELAASCGSGIGTRTVTITVLNIADSTTAISGFEIAVYDSSSGEPQANGTTNSNGVFTCSLKDETYTVHITNPPWSLTSPRRFVITANMDSTFYATAFTPGSPPADSLCVVYGYVKKSNGTPYVGAKVEMWMDAYPVTFGGILIDVVTKQVVYTNTAGRFEFSDGVYYSSSLNPSNLKWKIRVKTANWVWSGSVTVPSQASWEIEIPGL